MLHPKNTPGTPTKVPGIVRVCLGFHRVASAITRAESEFRNQFLWRRIPAPQRKDINLALYSEDRRYLPGGEYFEKGLFDWEERAITTPPFPSAGKILLGGCGGGRELAKLLDLGFEVLAFDPSPTFVHGAKKVVTHHALSSVVQASYEDLILAVNKQEGPLADHLQNRHFDGIILGWGSLSSLTELQTRQALFSALQTLAPQAPILLSFLGRNDLPTGQIEAWSARLRHRWNRKKRSDATEGDAFLPGIGFCHLFTPDEIKELASNAGYDVAKGDLAPYPHAILKPK